MSARQEFRRARLLLRGLLGLHQQQRRLQECRSSKLDTESRHPQSRRPVPRPVNGALIASMILSLAMLLSSRARASPRTNPRPSAQAWPCESCKPQNPKAYTPCKLTWKWRGAHFIQDYQPVHRAFYRLHVNLGEGKPASCKTNAGTDIAPLPPAPTFAWTSNAVLQEVPSFRGKDLSPRAMLLAIRHE